MGFSDKYIAKLWNTTEEDVCRQRKDAGILPMMHGGILSREGGQIGVGYARTPLECFRRALN